MRHEPTSLSEASRFFPADAITLGAKALGFRPSGFVASKDGVVLQKDEGKWTVHGPDDAIHKMRRVIAGKESPPRQAES